MVSRFSVLISYNMWSSNHFCISNCFPCFSGSKFFRVQVFQGLHSGSGSRVQSPGPGCGSRFQKQLFISIVVYTVYTSLFTLTCLFLFTLTYLLFIYTYLENSCGTEQTFLKILLLHHLVCYIIRLEVPVDDLQMRPLRQILLFLEKNSLTFKGEDTL